MTQIQLSIDDDIMKVAEQAALREGTSLNALFHQWLREYVVRTDAADTGIRRDGRLLIATGVLQGDALDHRQVLSERDRKLAGLS